jgi:hypothetical protein
MSIAHRLRRSAALCATICAALVPATAGVALAAPDPLAQERYYSSYETPDSSAALAQERYLSSYGEPGPLTLSQSSAPSDGTPWPVIALSITGALVIVAASATQLRRVRLRRRRAARSTNHQGARLRRARHRRAAAQRS